MKLKKEVKIVIALVLVLVLGIVMVISLFKPKSYEVEYHVNDYNITEGYDKEREMYTFTIEKDGCYYSFYSYVSYLKEHKRIQDIEEKKVEEEICLLIDAKELDVNPLCSRDNKPIDFRLTSKAMQEEIGYQQDEKETEPDTYNNLNVYNTLDYTYLVWNYKGFDVIKNKKKTSIDVFSKDQYEIPLSIQLGKYIILADYDSQYTFSNFMIVNIEKGTKEVMKTKEEISFDSYFVGGHDKSVYLVDRKNKIEYEIVPHKKKIRKVGTKYNKGILYKEDGFESISLTKLSGEDFKFYDDNPYRYEIMDNLLYQKVNNHTMQISNQQVNTIMCINQDTVVYLVEDTLYSYDLEHGETKVMSNFEWNFNYKNLIFIYNS